ncbi:MAG: TetR family transcriptional regulator [Rhizobiaceae bacterium]|nr:TetR family transcriptional regulator [Rhizobiaceae bacterium]
MHDLPILTEDPKRRRIIEAAAGHFLAYGFGRTTMDDIARAAEMSRPAVYLHFKNKTEIFRELAAGFAARMVAEAERILSGGGKLDERVTRMFELCFVALKEEMAGSPHGAELLDMKDTVTADLIATVRGRVAAALVKALEAADGDRTPAAPTPQALADILLDAFDGAKMRGATLAELRSLAGDLGRLAGTLRGMAPVAAPA